jgi:rod shape-determining protein MreB
MFASVIGLLSQDLGVDLGTSTTRIFVRGVGVVCREPTVVTVHTDARGRRNVMEVGGPAEQMLYRTPPDLDAVRPVRDGQIADYEVAEALLMQLVRRVQTRNSWFAPRMAVAVPHGAAEMELRAVRECCEAAGAREVHLVPRPRAAAMGADLPVDLPSGHMVIDVGAGGTDVSVLSLSGVVCSVTVAGGGDGMDQAVIRLIRERHGLIVGPRTARALREAGSGGATGLMARGRCAERGVPSAVRVAPREILEALAPGFDAIVATVRRVLERAEPEIASDVVDNGAVLTGGGSRQAGLEAALRACTGLAIVTAEGPEDATIRGCGKMLERNEVVLRALA